MTVVRLVNPLPEALLHYERQTAAVLSAAGVEHVSESRASTEVGSASHLTRLRVGAQILAERRQASVPHRRLVLWPAFGSFEPLTWRREDPVSLVVHDPTPLRPQFGLGAFARRLGTVLPAGRLEIVVLSDPARADLEAPAGTPVVQLPHPILAPAPVEREGRALTVLGQFKPTRDLAVLAELAASGLDLPRRLVGRGWPGVAGWEHVDGFVPEEELDGHLRASAATVIPYRHFYQSNIAVRALEVLTPVVGPRHPMLEDLWGADWPGLVEPGSSWAEATARAVEVPAAAIAERRQAYWERCLAAWSGWAAAR